MGGSILGFGYTFSYDHHLLGWFEYAMAAASEFVRGLFVAAPHQSVAAGPNVGLAQL